MKKSYPYISLALLWLCTTSQSTQSALQSNGPQSALIQQLWWIFLTVLGIVYIIVMAILVRGLLNSRKKDLDDFPQPVPDSAESVDTESEVKAKRNVAIALGITAVILIGLTIASYAGERTLLSHDIKDLLIIEVKGHQWWWDFRYVDSNSSQRVKAANEIHIPVGRPVLFRGTSSDVIHSLWIPNLHGKKDLIPGYTSEMILSADKPGRFRGQCAEFCGHQHAHMAFWVVADAPHDYDLWAEAQLKPAQDPIDPQAQRGKEVFLAAACVMCHTVSGTDAGASAAPDLTHLASRSTIAAGSLPNNAQNLEAWIRDPQSIKPGAKMPPNQLKTEDMHALVAYLRSLK